MISRSEGLRYSFVIGLFFYVGLGFASAEDLSSTNYKIIDATINSTGEALNSSTYKTITSIGDFSSDPRYYSASYQLKGGPLELFVANVPKVLCLETSTDGFSQCINGPSYLNSNGMVTVCGQFGCYDKARIEIDTQNNPSDTLYSIEISTDNFVNDVRLIDPTTRTPKTFTTKTISDFATADQWHDYNDSFGTGWNSSYNITGLKPNTTYYVRVTALHGDFTESSYSPTVTVTTTEPTLSFDIDIAPVGSSSTETTAPYELDLFMIPDQVVTSNNLIWEDIGTNLNSGATVYVKGFYGGLNSSYYTITSSSVDLSTVAEGFGIQHDSLTQSYTSSTGSGELPTISVNTVYSQPGDSVGAISQGETSVYSANGPVYMARTSLFVKAKSTNTTPSGSYTEIITFLLKATP